MSSDADDEMMVAQEVVIDNQHHSPDVQPISQSPVVQPITHFVSSYFHRNPAQFSPQEIFHLNNERTQQFYPHPDSLQEVADLSRVIRNTNALRIEEPLDLSTKANSHSGT